jgi:murein DD-endopeptidase MepM/ murein hydrolase activator NlpD
MLQEDNEIHKAAKKKKLHPVLLGIIACALLITGFALYYNNNTAFCVVVDGEEVGVVKNKEDFQSVIDELAREAEERLGSEVKFLIEADFRRIKGLSLDITPKEEIKQVLNSKMEYKVKAAAIQISGEKVVWVEDEETARRVLDAVKAAFIKEDENSKLEGVEIEEEVLIVEDYISPDKLMDKERAVSTLLRGTDEIKVHKVKKGESLWLIARNNSMTVSDLKNANPDIKSETLQIGQELNLIVPKPYLNVITKEVITYNKGIPYPTKIEYDDSLWSWETRIKQNGIYGTKEVTARVVRKNGVEIEREILEERVLKEPVYRILTRGTKTAPSRGTGRFLWPTIGRISSPFGKRGREFHTGVDIAAPVGTPVRAADSGTVTFAGWNGGYGRLIIVDHGNGFTTYYAHNSKLLVGVGDKVEKGQTISLVGSSGRSTGPHLHFEIRKNGEPLNPLNFFKK